MRASVYIAASVDGFIAREDGDIDWLQTSGEEKASEDYGYKDFISSVDAIIMGRNTFQKVLTFGDWPYGAKRVVVMSSHPVEIPDDISGSVESTSLQPKKLLSSLSKQGVSHVYVDGGLTIQGFLRDELIDQLIVTRIPRLIGRGIPLFGALDKDIVLRHIRTDIFPGGLVQNRYEVVRGDA